MQLRRLRSLIDVVLHATVGTVEPDTITIPKEGLQASTVFVFSVVLAVRAVNILVLFLCAHRPLIGLVILVSMCTAGLCIHCFALDHRRCALICPDVLPINCMHALTSISCVCAWMGVGDSGELVVTTCNLGVAHPPGYPLFSMLGYLTNQLIPFGHKAWRINMMSSGWTGSCLVVRLMVALTHNMYATRTVVW